MSDPKVCGCGAFVKEEEWSEHVIDHVLNELGAELERGETFT